MADERDSAQRNFDRDQRINEALYQQTVQAEPKSIAQHQELIDSLGSAAEAFPSSVDQFTQMFQETQAAQKATLHGLQDTSITAASMAAQQSANLDRPVFATMPDVGRISGADAMVSSLGDVATAQFVHVPNPEERLLKAIGKLSVNVQRLTEAVNALTAKLTEPDDPPTA